MLLILVVFAVLAALLCHSLLKSFWIACSASALLATLVFWMVAASHFGWFDRMFYKNLATALIVSLAVSIGVGVFLRALSKRSPD